MSWELFFSGRPNVPPVGLIRLSLHSHHLSNAECRCPLSSTGGPVASDLSVCCLWLRACVDGSWAGVCHFLFSWRLQFVVVPLTQDVPFRNLQLPRRLKKIPAVAQVVGHSHGSTPRPAVCLWYTLSVVHLTCVRSITNLCVNLSRLPRIIYICCHDVTWMYSVFCLAGPGVCVINVSAHITRCEWVMGKFFPPAYLISETAEWFSVMYDATHCRANWLSTGLSAHRGFYLSWRPYRLYLKNLLQNFVPNTIYVAFRVHSFGVFELYRPVLSVNVKVKVKFTQCTQWRRIGGRGMAPLIRDLDIRCRWVVSFKSKPV